MENDKKEPVKVFLVNPPSENPWRTRQDYLDDQRREKVQFRITIAAIVFSFLSVVATAIIAVESIERMTELHSTTVNGIDPSFIQKLKAN